jgi:predicted nucleic acid-binding Zn finger protein
MQLSPTYRAILRVIPDLSWIYNFKEALGRGRCPWVHGLTKAGKKVARFLKKGLIKLNVWLNDSEVVSLNRDRIYTVSQSECTCPEWRHRISQDKGYRHIPGLFKGYVDRCKHQVAQWLNQHDVSQFSSYIDIEPERYNVIKLSETAAPEGISFVYQEENYPVLCFDVYFNHNCIGEITENPDDFEVSTPKGYCHTFPSQKEAIRYLLKQQELSAARDLFGDDMYPELEPEPQPKKQQKQWLSFSGLSGFKQQVTSNEKEEINLLGDYGNWLEPDPAWNEYEEF